MNLGNLENNMTKEKKIHGIYLLLQSILQQAKDHECPGMQKSIESEIEKIATKYEKIT